MHGIERHRRDIDGLFAALGLRGDISKFEEMAAGVHPAQCALKRSLRSLRQNHVYETYRFVLKSDNAAVTVTGIILKPGIKAEYGYDKHIEIAYCIEGHATLTDLATGKDNEISAGTMWITQQGDTFAFSASEPTRLLCVFSPAFDSQETGFVGEQ